MTDCSPSKTGLELPTDYGKCLGRCGQVFGLPQRIPFCRRCVALMTPKIQENLRELERQVHRAEAWIESWRLHSIRQCLRHLKLIPAIYGLTCKNPWAWGIAHRGKPIENRTRPLPCEVGSYLAIHAGAATDPAGEKWIREHIGIVPAITQKYRAVVAICRFGGAVQNSSDPWAMPGFVHNVLTDTVAIDPVPMSGAQGLWILPNELLEIVLGNYKAARDRQRQRRPV